MIDGPTLGLSSNRGSATAVGATVERQYLIVFHGETSANFALPSTGSVLIGRSDEAQLRIDDQGVSRRHAALALDQGEARLMDLGSHNGVWVNGERIAASRLLISGDSITIGSATLVYHGGGRGRPRQRLEFAALRQRLAEEVERAARFSHDIAIVVLHGGEAHERAAIDAACARLARRGGIVGADVEGGAVVLLPETDVATALAALGAQADAARVGYASCPLDGSDPDALLIGARAAAERATRGKPLAAGAACQSLRVGGAEVVVADPAMQRLFAFVERIAATELPVLLTGETGTGKELLATVIHGLSARREGPFVLMRCVGLSDLMVERELFGGGEDETERRGCLERASGGTLFFDEIGELGLAAQAKLLRAIETRRVVRIGEADERAIDLRIVAATNHAIEEKVQAGLFRSDLYFRLTGAKLWLPPLRDRPRELPILAQRFLAAARAEVGAPAMAIAPAAMRRLAEHHWPGNVRELKHAMGCVAAAYADEVLRPHHLSEWLSGLPAEPGAAPAPATDEAEEEEAPRFRPLEEEIRELEIQRISAALAATGGNQTRAAELIGMPLRTFVNKLKRHGIVAERRT
jgi:DNA-binding NtrC family response regulator